jgi:hypothetical protein
VPTYLSSSVATALITAGGDGWRESEWTVHGEAKRKPGLLSTAAGDAIDLRILLDAPPQPLDLSQHVIPSANPRVTCVGISYLRSFEHMGSAHVTCVPPCKCAPLVVNGLGAEGTSLFETREFGAQSESPDRECVLRIVNLGCRASDHRTHREPAAWADQHSGNCTKFRIGGIFTSVRVSTSASTSASRSYNERSGHASGQQQHGQVAIVPFSQTATPCTST